MAAVHHWSQEEQLPASVHAPQRDVGTKANQQLKEEQEHFVGLPLGFSFQSRMLF